MPSPTWTTRISQWAAACRIGFPPATGNAGSRNGKPGSLSEDPDPIVAAVARRRRSASPRRRLVSRNIGLPEIESRFRGQSFASLLEETPNLRPSFIGHVLVELILDASPQREVSRENGILLRADRPKVDSQKIEDAVNLFSSRPTRQTGPGHRAISSRKDSSYDYDTDEGIVYRMNRVFARIKLPSARRHDSLLVARGEGKSLAGGRGSPAGISPASCVEHVKQSRFQFRGVEDLKPTLRLCSLGLTDFLIRSKGVGNAEFDVLRTTVAAPQTHCSDPPMESAEPF